MCAGAFLRNNSHSFKSPIVSNTMLHSTAIKIKESTFYYYIIHNIKYKVKADKKVPYGPIVEYIPINLSNPQKVYCCTFFYLIFLLVWLSFPLKRMSIVSQSQSQYFFILKSRSIHRLTLFFLAFKILVFFGLLVPLHLFADSLPAVE